MQPSAADQANQDFIDRLIAQGSLWSPPLIRAFRTTPRHRFLERVFQYETQQECWREAPIHQLGPEEVRLVYSDRALITRLSNTVPPTPISSSSQPSLMAQLLQDLRLAPGLRVLEVGAGTGYNAALLAHLVGPGRVVSVDVDRQVLAEAREHLQAFAERGVEVRHADGRLGYPEAAPFDRLMVTAATPDLEPAWLEQVAEGGLLLAPLALAPGLAYALVGTVRGGVFRGRLTRGAYFMPLRAEQDGGSAEREAEEGQNLGRYRALRAPWGNWFEQRRPRKGWLLFVQALAFYALLRGLQVEYESVDDQPGFRVHDAQAGCTCVFAHRAWHVSGPRGRDLGWGLWRAFLDAGGPWPTDFDLVISVDTERLTGTEPESYVRQGPRCRQLWRLRADRERPPWI